VVFNLILGIILAGTFNPGASLVQFGVVVVGGLLIGLILGYAFSFVLSQVDDYLIETVLTIVLAYGTYFLAQLIHVSGIIAIVAAGLLVGNYGQRVAFSPTSKIGVGLSWELFGFLANSLIFLFVGLQIRSAHFENALPIVAVAIAAVLLSRGLVVALTSAAIRALRQDRPLPVSWQTVLVWGGLRGALSLALALSIPLTLGGTRGAFPERETILVMTFGVILFSLLVQGLTMQPLLKRLRLFREGGDLAEYESTQARLRAISAALNLLEARGRAGQVPPDVLKELRDEYAQRQQSLREHLTRLNIQTPALREQAVVAERRALLQTEKSTLRDLFTRGLIGEESLRELSGDVDRRLHALDSGPPDDEEAETEGVPAQEARGEPG
jgi:CPA1 family monovalent cation:H+ antiporter